jgi:hypothetical protein
MEATRRFSILPFPQLFKNERRVNIVVAAQSESARAGHRRQRGLCGRGALFEAHLGQSAGFPHNFWPGQF